MCLNRIGRTECFWDFSVRIYSQDGAAKACLQLQNLNSCDVNMLLYCCWTGLSYGSIPEDILNAAIDYSQRWSTQVVQPLRNARVWMKDQQWMQAADNHEVLREHIKSSELEAEHLQQTVLEQLASQMPIIIQDAESTLESCKSNLNRYLQTTGVIVDQAASNNLLLLLRATVTHLNVEVSSEW